MAKIKEFDIEMNEILSKAIGTHSKWSFLLQEAIKSGKSSYKPEIVKTDNNCDFGKWLYNDAPESFKNSPVYREVKSLHAQFHIEASRILRVALSGKKDEALMDMGLNSEYKKLSSALVLKLASLKSNTHENKKAFEI